MFVFLFGGSFQCQGRILKCSDSVNRTFTFTGTVGKARPPPEAKATCDKSKSDVTSKWVQCDKDQTRTLFRVRIRSPSCYMTIMYRPHITLYYVVPT